MRFTHPDDVLTEADAARSFLALIERLPDVVIRFDLDGRIVYANPAVETLTGFPREAFLGHRPHELLMPASVVDEWDRARQAILLAGVVRDWDFPYETPDARRWFHAVAVAEHDDDGALRHVSLAARDITRLKELEARLAREAREDHLTGLSTRRHFFDVASTVAGQTVGVCVIDVDDFKVINDRHGHAIGDDVLEVIARRLRGATRPIDVVSRHGGDEFAVLVTGSPTLDELSALGDRLMASLRRPVALAGAELAVSVSAGIAIGDEDVVQLLDRADHALYQAKAAGKNHWVAAP